MHCFYIHKCFLYHQFLQRGLPPSIHHLHLSTISAHLVLESVKGEAFLLIFSTVGLLLYEQNSILEEIPLAIGLNNSCIWRFLE